MCIRDRLMTVAANLSKNKIDYNRIRTTDELQDTLVAEKREDLSFVWEAVKQLPSKYSEVIHLFYYEGYSTACLLYTSTFQSRFMPTRKLKSVHSRTANGSV